MAGFFKQLWGGDEANEMMRQEILALKEALAQSRQDYLLEINKLREESQRQIQGLIQEQTEYKKSIQLMKQQLQEHQQQTVSKDQLEQVRLEYRDLQGRYEAVQKEVQVLLEENNTYKEQLKQVDTEQEKIRINQEKQEQEREHFDQQIEYLKDQNDKQCAKYNHNQLAMEQMQQEIHSLKEQLNKQQVQMEQQQNEAKILVKAQESNDLPQSQEKYISTIDEPQQQSKNLLDSILDYEWDDEEDFDFLDTNYSTQNKQENVQVAVNSVQHNDQSTYNNVEESITKGIHEAAKEKSIYEQFKEYIAEHEINNDPNKEFVLHAQWMAEYEEDQMPTEAIAFRSITPTYKDMSIEQMKWYFYWRTNARKEKFALADVGYILLYTYEILNNVGVKNYEEGHKQLSSILKEYGEIYRDVEGQLPQWIHDYLIIYGDAKNLFNLTEELKKVAHNSHFVERAYFIRCLLLKDYSQLTEMLNKFSDYKVVRQTFYKDVNNRPIYDKVLKSVVIEIDQYLKKVEQVDFAEKIMGPTKVDYWKVFNHAPVDLEGLQSRYPTYKVTDKIRYWYDGKRWNTTYSGMRNDFDRIYITNLLKYIESVLCAKLKIKRDLKLGTIPQYVEQIVQKVVEQANLGVKVLDDVNSIQKKPEVLKNTMQSQNLAEVEVIQVAHLKDSKEQEIENNCKEDNIYNLISKLFYKEDIRQNGYKFFKQAKSMENQENFSISMSNGEDAQKEVKLIREYFKWRQAVRSGIYKEAEEIYVYTYIYELINDVGIKDEQDGLQKLIGILEHYGSQFKGLTERLSRWIVDYVIYYRAIPEAEFYRLLKHLDIHSATSQEWGIIALLMGQQVSDPLFCLNRISAYDITKSVNYIGRTKKAVHKAVHAVVSQIAEVLNANQNLMLYNLVMGDQMIEKDWMPFEEAVFYNKAKHLLLNTKVEYTINQYIKYSMRRGFWKTTRPTISELENNENVANILKCVEYHVCKRLGTCIGKVNNINIPEFLEQFIMKIVEENIE